MCQAGKRGLQLPQHVILLDQKSQGSHILEKSLKVCLFSLHLVSLPRVPDHSFISQCLTGSQTGSSTTLCCGGWKRTLSLCSSAPQGALQSARSTAWHTKAAALFILSDVDEAMWPVKQMVRVNDFMASSSPQSVPAQAVKKSPSSRQHFPGSKVPAVSDVAEAALH